LCIKYDKVVISDEIFSDMVIPPHKHIPLPLISEEIAQRTVLLNSASKAFNLSGLVTGYAIIKNESMLKKYTQYCLSIGVFFTNVVGMKALEVA